jgi:hypothetical protein
MHTHTPLRTKRRKEEKKKRRKEEKKTPHRRQPASSHEIELLFDSPVNKLGESSTHPILTFLAYVI